MSHLPAMRLKRWNSKEKLSAADLNGNFDTLLAAIETVMAAALMPDPAVNGLEVRIHKCEERLARIEKMLEMHARQRNEKEWAPMAYVAHVMQLVQNLTGPLSDRADGLLAAHTELQGQHHAISTRIARLEQQPDAALAEDHQALAAAHQELDARAKMTLGQVIAIRHEVGHLTKMAMGHARNRNEMEYTPLAATSDLLRRVTEIEKQLPKFGMEPQ